MSQNKVIKDIAIKINQSKHLVIFSGAGISTESGLSDYRGPTGVWTRRDMGLKPLPSPNLSEVAPNTGHKALVELQNLGLMKFLISQNVDGLHLQSGIDQDLMAELHGNHLLMKCIVCDMRFKKDSLNWNPKWGKSYRTDAIHEDQPNCSKCKGRIISSIVNFGDPMPEKEMQMATKHSKLADVFLIVGSSLVVQPAASLPMYCYDNGGDIIILNIGKTPLDSIAKYKIDEKVGTILEKILLEIKRFP